MDNKEFFDWFRSQQKNKRLTQNMVDGANELLSVVSADKAKEILAKINNWSLSYMQLSEKGLSLIKEFEGFSSKPYRDSVGVWTIGYGNTYYLDGSKVKSTDKHLSEQEASKLKLDIINRDFVPEINRIFANEIEQNKINQNQFDALILLSYNIGISALSNSRVARYIKTGDMAKAADSFLLWNKAGGRVLNGLIKRREKERRLFLSEQ